MKSRVALFCALIVATACARPAEPDAYGNVESTDVIVSAEASGRLVMFDVTEGQMLTADAIVASVDPTQLGLEHDQAEAQRAVNSSRANEVTRQIDVLDAQRAAAVAQRDAARAQRLALVDQQEIARRAHERTQRLFAQQAATAQQLDQAERDDRVLSEQIKAQDEQINAQDQQIAAQTRQIAAMRVQVQTAMHQVTSSDAQVAQVAERIRKAQVKNPIAGTVLATYAKAGEVVQPGQPLYRIADLSAVDVRAFVSETQLANLRVGQSAQISVDIAQNQRKTLSGSISWVSSRAEFTPTPIQTRDERAALVYAIKIRVANPDGLLKIGMPVDVRFGSTPGPQ
jgi:HlyD family secretion protein